MIGRSGERGSGISVLAARHDDDDTNLNSLKSNLVLNDLKRVDTPTKDTRIL